MLQSKCKFFGLQVRWPDLLFLLIRASAHWSILFHSGLQYESCINWLLHTTMQLFHQSWALWLLVDEAWICSGEISQVSLGGSHPTALLPLLLTPSKCFRHFSVLLKNHELCSLSCHQELSWQLSKLSNGLFIASWSDRHSRYSPHFLPSLWMSLLHHC